MSALSTTLEVLLRRYERRVELDQSDRDALINLPFRVQGVEPARYIAREGIVMLHSALLLSGICYRHRLTHDGSRQIVSIHITGDFIDLENSLLGTADHNIQALTRCEVANVPVAAITALIDHHPRIARAMWIDTLIDGSIFREWIVNVGRRDARSRIAHLLCEFARRLDASGVKTGGRYEFPMTQEQLADATGLTAVHVNRTLKKLESEGLIKREKRFLIVPHWERLRDAAGFNELYLHLEPAAA